MMSDEAETPPYYENLSHFLAALRLSESVTGFSARLIEKDYYGSIVLQDLAVLFRQGLVFKGGTSLSKVHTEFFRLSEDLDFSVSLSPAVSRRTRRAAAEPFKNHFANLPTRLGCFQVAGPVSGHDESRQYSGQLAYRSVITGEDEFLLVEVGFREELLLPARNLPARTLLMNLHTNEPAVSPFDVRVLEIREAFAEKVRAALTRRDPAIRDFFDIDHAVQKGLLNPLAPDFLQLVTQKLAGTMDPVDTSSNKVSMLKAQLETQLKPVLRVTNYEEFVLDRAITLLEKVVAGLP